MAYTQSNELVDNHNTEHTMKEIEQCSLKVEQFTLEIEQLKQNQFATEALEKSNEKVLFLQVFQNFPS